jgi:hypothetical protein
LFDKKLYSCLKGRANRAVTTVRYLGAENQIAYQLPKKAIISKIFQVKQNGKIY